MAGLALRRPSHLALQAILQALLGGGGGGGGLSTTSPTSGSAGGNETDNDRLPESELTNFYQKSELDVAPTRRHFSGVRIPRVRRC
ncbi:hypothetical protein LY76DRAFT_430408 [Colletotrichum caudatum]|nr:hypothetical protein LY76DRAFT_430408 [Colletotrichum caudatum]